MKLSAFVLFILLLFINSLVISGGKNPGDKIEDITLKGTDGKEYILSKANTGKGVVIMFWSTECPYVQPYTSRINELAKTYTDKGFTFWGVNANFTQKIDEVREHAKEKGYVFTMTKDENSKAAVMLGATKTPEIFVISPEMVVLYHGRIDDNRDEDKVSVNDLKNALDDISEGRDVKVKSTKSFGCGIKIAE